MSGLEFKVTVDMTEVNQLKETLKECNKDAKELGLTKRQIKVLMRQISKEGSSYRKFINQGYQPTSSIKSNPPDQDSAVRKA